MAGAYVSLAEQVAAAAITDAVRSGCNTAVDVASNIPFLGRYIPNPCGLFPNLHATPIVDNWVQNTLMAIADPAGSYQCGISGNQQPIYCVESNNFPAFGPARAIMYGHYIFCKGSCDSELTKHEMVHVNQWERDGTVDFAIQYIGQIANGVKCGNILEKEAYAVAGGPC